MIKSIEGYSYKINQHIGKGYSSTVHKGKKDCSGQDVSVKVIEMAKLQDPINHMLLQYQVSALKTLAGSTNILHLYDVYATKNNTYIITQLMQGDLHTLLKQKKQFPYYEACEIIKQIIVGYYDVYKNGFLHRDIKPANIFYKNGTYKIGDFGFAIPSKDSIQHRGYNVGSPVYMPPEALKQNKYSVSCDTWAIGIIFYQILKGLVPWRAISQPKLYDKIMSQPLIELSTGLPQIARTFLSKLLHLDPYQRMSPQQLINWPGKLMSVQIRSVTPMQHRPMNQKVALQQISLPSNNFAENHISTYSRSKSYSSSQVPNYVSGVRINLTNNGNVNNQISTMNKIVVNNKLLGPSSTNNNSSQLNISEINNYHSTKGQQSPAIFSQKNSTIITNEQKKQLSSVPLMNKKVTKVSAQQYGRNMISYIKFINKLVKLISSPSDIQLKDLQLSLTRNLHKQIQRIKKYIDPQNCESLNIQGWKEYIKSTKGNQKFVQKLNKLSQKYKIFNPIPKNQFILDVYKQQLLDGIKKIFLFISEHKQSCLDKTILGLECLVNFYQIWNWKQNIQNKKNNLKEFLDNWNFNEMMQKSQYVVKKGLVNEVKQKIKRLADESKIQEKTILKDVQTNYLRENELIKLI